MTDNWTKIDISDWGGRYMERYAWARKVSDRIALFITSPKHSNTYNLWQVTVPEVLPERLREHVKRNEPIVGIPDEFRVAWACFSTDETDNMLIQKRDSLEYAKADAWSHIWFKILEQTGPLPGKKAENRLLDSLDDSDKKNPTEKEVEDIWLSILREGDPKVAREKLARLLEPDPIPGKNSENSSPSSMPISTVWLSIFNSLVLEIQDPADAATKADACLEEYKKRWLR